MCKPRLKSSGEVWCRRGHSMILFHFKFKLGTVMIFTGLLLAANASAGGQLKQYISRPDSAFHWEHIQTSAVARGRIYKLHLTSQVWHGIRWQHQLQVYEPKGCAIRIFSCCLLLAVAPAR